MARERYAQIKAYTGYTLSCSACAIEAEGVSGEVQCSREDALVELRGHNADPTHRMNVRRRHLGLDPI